MINTRVFAVPKENSNSKSVGGTTTANSSTIRFDTQLSNSSQNGVQNKVIYAAIIELIQEIANTDNTLELLRTGQKVTINSNTWKYNTDTGNLYFNGTVNVNNLLANAATVGNLSGTDLDFTNADIDNLNSADAIIENLTVTKAAHFFELIIDQIKSTQGQVIITAANAKLDLVEESQNGFKCYWKNTDGDKIIYNQFELNDLVICQTFNLDDATGTHQTNKFYWSKVIGVGTETKNGETYNYIILSTNDYDSRSNAVPEAGDEIVQLGNKTNTDRQAAIIISAYNNQFLDPTIQAPSIVQYDGINEYSISTHRLNVISKGLNQFKGNFSTTAGDLQAQINNTKKKVFPIQKPFYTYNGDVVTDYLSDPIRYNGGDDIYSTPVFVDANTYSLRIFCTIGTASTLESYFQLCTYGTTYPSSIGDDYSSISVTLQRGTDTISAKGGQTLYEYEANITITTAGYYCINFWGSPEYLYVPEETDGFETNYSRITQTNNRITTQVANLNGQISSIDQKADSIELAVNDTNVRLDNGQFTINADTEINGALTVTSADKGFILNSSGGNTYIVGDSIGTYQAFKTKNYIVNTYQTASIVNATSDSPQFTFTVNLGSLPLNTDVDFIQMRASFKKPNSGEIYTYNSYNYTIALYKGTTPVKSMNGTNTNLPSDVRYTTNSVADTYTAQITLTPQLNLSEYPTAVEASFYFQLKIYTQTFNIIGTDGLASNFGTNKTFYVGNEGTYIRYNDDNVLKISTAGIQKYAGDTYGRQQQKGYLQDTCISRYLSEYSPINGVAVRMVTNLNSNTSQCYLQPNDEMIVFNLASSDNSKRLNIFLGNPSGKIGRRVYLKKTNSYGSLYIFGTDNSTTDTSANYTIKTADNGTTYLRDEINSASLMYVSDGTYWNEYYCG